MVDFKYYLNRQGPKGNTGEKGDQGQDGITPIPSTGINNPTTYTIKWDLGSGNSWETENLRVPVTDEGGTYVRWNGTTQYYGEANKADLDGNYGEVRIVNTSIIDNDEVEDTDVISYKDFKSAIDLKADVTNVANALNLKADKSNTYTKSEVDNMVTDSIGNGTVTINQGDTFKGSFTLNQSGNVTIDLDEGGGSQGINFTPGDALSIDQNTEVLNVLYDNTSITLNENNQLQATPTDLSDYYRKEEVYTKDEVDSLIPEIPEQVYTFDGGEIEYVEPDPYDGFILGPSPGMYSPTNYTQCFREIIINPGGIETFYKCLELGDLFIDTSRGDNSVVKINPNSIETLDDGTLLVKTYIFDGIAGGYNSGTGVFYRIVNGSLLGIDIDHSFTSGHGIYYKPNYSSFTDDYLTIPEKLTENNYLAQNITIKTIETETMFGPVDVTTGLPLHLLQVPTNTSTVYTSYFTTQGTFTYNPSSDMLISPLYNTTSYKKQGLFITRGNYSEGDNDKYLLVYFGSDAIINGEELYAAAISPSLIKVTLLPLTKEVGEFSHTPLIGDITFDDDNNALEVIDIDETNNLFIVQKTGQSIFEYSQYFSYGYYKIIGDESSMASGSRGYTNAKLIQL